MHLSQSESRKFQINGKLVRERRNFVWGPECWPARSKTLTSELFKFNSKREKYQTLNFPFVRSTMVKARFCQWRQDILYLMVPEAEQNMAETNLMKYLVGRLSIMSYSTKKKPSSRQSFLVTGFSVTRAVMGGFLFGTENGRGGSEEITLYHLCGCKNIWKYYLKYLVVVFVGSRNIWKCVEIFCWNIWLWHLVAAASCKTSLPGH